jgi:hypothetical protein
MATASSNPPSDVPAWRQLATHWRVIITLALLFHLTAIIAAPWSGPEPAGPLSSEIVKPFREYLDITYSGHGYRFFAPAPGPGHIVRYKLTFADGTTREDEFPNRHIEWPRLFYHRHFMLAEKLNGLFDAEEPGRDAPPEARAEWQAIRKIFETTAQSYAMHLLETTGAKEVDVQLVRHNLPFPDQVERGMKLTDARNYQVLWKHTYQAGSS